ncbi:hypothetical protein AAG570_011389 [Ranatra chinensis]|uniref:Uncharacterized protein n=1 Tax=Ranatra chinensis TaxID=642074 RepID=A0ABD0YKG6_9HEMI
MATVLAENYQLKWHSHSAHLHTSVATLYRSDNFTDVTLVTTDGRYLAAHKFVLSACSAYLNRILHITCLGANTNSNVVVVLPPDISYRTLAILLQYMYSGEATVSNDQLNGVLKAGEILRIKGLCRNKDKRPSSDSGRKDKSQAEKLIEHENSGESSKEGSPINTGSDIQIEENMKIELLVKEEPLDWDDQDESCENNQQDIEQSISFKSERQSPDNDDSNLYAPLTCDLCQETFTTPALWVRHIEKHPPTDVPRKRRKKTAGSDDQDDESSEFPPLRCELCQEVFGSPGDWVRHIQSAHTEEQLAVSNSAATTRRKSSSHSGGRETCPSCMKTFPSHASMLIHSRTHTGEKPYVCCVCEKGFNVKSNLLRHLRTLHDHLINPGNVSTNGTIKPKKVYLPELQI